MVQSFTASQSDMIGSQYEVLEHPAIASHHLQESMFIIPHLP